MSNVIDFNCHKAKKEARVEKETTLREIYNDLERAREKLVAANLKGCKHKDRRVKYILMGMSDSFCVAMSRLMTILEEDK